MTKETSNCFKTISSCWRTTMPMMIGWSSLWVSFLLLLSAAMPQIGAFSVEPRQEPHSSAAARRPQISGGVLLHAAAAAAAADNPKALFEMEGWGAIQKDLDRVPIFTVATPEGNPLAYQVTINKDEPYTVPFFYCDVDDALKELEGAKNSTSMKGLDIVPFPLGKAFQLWCQDEAVIVPSKQAVMQAGAPPGTNPVGQQVPMFACLEIMEENEDGTGVLPLFMSLDDANAAVQEAANEAEDTTTTQQEELKVICLSLSGAVEQLATVPETPGFHFIPPSTSMKYIAEYLS